MLTCKGFRTVRSLGSILLSVVLCGVLCLDSGCTWIRGAMVPAHPFVRPDGPFSVGTREFDWTDPLHGEPFTRNPSDYRRTSVQVWYPTDAPGIPAHYVLHPHEQSDKETEALAGKVYANATLNAPLASGKFRFPVLIYHHGFQATRWSASFSTEWFASHGYIVFSIEHFGPGSQTIRFLDGAPFKADLMAIPAQSGDIIKDTAAFKSYLAQIFAIWTTDALFCIDQIEKLNTQPGDFRGRLDLQKIGAFGSSLGGALAIEVSKIDPRIKAAINLDGTLFGTIREDGTPRPVMIISHDPSKDLDEVPARYLEDAKLAIAAEKAVIASTRERSTADWFSVIIAGAEHLDFSDYPLFSQGLSTRSGDITPKRVQEITNTYALAFFDRYLKGTHPEILKVNHNEYPEAAFEALLRSSVSGESTPQ
jgi:dienelactone hydrolase